jgi:hypothetical protein
MGCPQTMQDLRSLRPSSRPQDVVLLFLITSMVFPIAFRSVQTTQHHHLRRYYVAHVPYVSEDHAEDHAGPLKEGGQEGGPAWQPLRFFRRPQQHEECHGLHHSCGRGRTPAPTASYILIVSQEC